MNEHYKTTQQNVVKTFLISIVEFLADKFKASIYDRTRDGSTLMHIAAVNGHPETAKILFDRGVSLHSIRIQSYHTTHVGSFTDAK